MNQGHNDIDRGLGLHGDIFLANGELAGNGGLFDNGGLVDNGGQVDSLLDNGEHVEQPGHMILDVQQVVACFVFAGALKRSTVEVRLATPHHPSGSYKTQYTVPPETLKCALVSKVWQEAFLQWHKKEVGKMMEVLSNYNNHLCSCLRLLCRFFLTFRDAAFFRVLASLGAKFAMRQAILLNLRTLQE